VAAHGEFSSLVNAERTKRYEILSKRIVQTGGLVALRVMDELLKSSELTIEIRNLEVPHQAILYTNESPEQSR
jgi:hypothetical protein